MLKVHTHVLLHSLVEPMGMGSCCQQLCRLTGNSSAATAAKGTEQLPPALPGFPEEHS